MANWYASDGILNTTLSLITSTGYVFGLKKLKYDIKIALKPAGRELYEIPIKIYHSVYTCKRKRFGTIAE